MKSLIKYGLAAAMVFATAMPAMARMARSFDICAGGTDLAGVVALRLILGSAGSVRAAEIVRRTWSGPGAAETEACLLGIARGWRVPAGSEGATMTIPISFTRGT